MQFRCLNIYGTTVLFYNTVILFSLNLVKRNYLLNLQYRVYNTMVHPINLTFSPFYKNIKQNVFLHTNYLNVYQLITGNGVCFKKATATVNVTVAVWGEYLIVSSNYSLLK